MRVGDLVQQAEEARAARHWRAAAALYLQAADTIRGPYARLYLDEAIALHDRARAEEQFVRVNAVDPRRW
jgi:hypothetical protein